MPLPSAMKMDCLLLAPRYIWFVVVHGIFHVLAGYNFAVTGGALTSNAVVKLHSCFRDSYVQIVVGNVESEYV